MQFEDKWLDCINCGKPFVFSARDQKYYVEQGFKNEPKRCRECRADIKRKKKTVVDANGVEKDLFKSICAACGRATYVPFKPTGSKPIYCRDCLVAKKIEAQLAEQASPDLPVCGANPTPPPPPSAT